MYKQTMLVVTTETTYLVRGNPGPGIALTIKMVVFSCLVVLIMIIVADPSFAQNKGIDLFEVDGRNYSLIKAPPDDSKIVEDAKKEINVTLNLEDITADFDIIAKCLQLAYNGLVIHPKLQGEIKNLQIKVLTLFDNSEVAFNDFARESSKVLSLLESTYGFLYKAKLKIAQQTFASLSDIASKMAAKAKSLKEEYEEDLKETKNLLGKAHDEQHNKLDKNNKALKEKKEMEAKMQRLEVARYEAIM
jgi:hypothetical protein